MNNREFKIKNISDELTKIELNVRNLNCQNLNDINVISEILFRDILNIVFDYKLINLSESSAKFPAIDLADDINRIAVQISSNKSKLKIQSTINSFEDYKFYEKYDRLIFLVIGEKQKKYSNLKLSDKFTFNIEEDIIDFKSLFRFISFSSIDKIDKTLTRLQAEYPSICNNNKKGEISRTSFKQIQSLKKKIEKNLIRKFTQQELYKYRDYFSFDPSRKFVYSHLIVRSIEDKGFPDGDSWFKGEIWDFYEGGLEFVFLSSKNVVIEADESWCFVENKDDKSLGCCQFLRIPYENIVSLDMEPDGYYGYPTLYVVWSKDHNLYNKIVYGLIGYYKWEKPNESRMTYYLDEDKEKKV